MKIILFTLLMFLSKSVMACSCGWGEYFYTIDSLFGEPENPSNYYLKNYGVNDLNGYKSKTLLPVIEDNGHGNLSITVPISKEIKGNIFRFVLESVVGVENSTGKGFVNTSIFSTLEFTPSENVLEVTGRMNTKGNEWMLHILAIDTEGKIVAKAFHTGHDTCGTDIYVSSVERAKELDLKRNSGCLQSWGYYKE